MISEMMMENIRCCNICGQGDDQFWILQMNQQIVSV